MNKSWQGESKIPIDHRMIAPTFPMILGWPLYQSPSLEINSVKHCTDFVELLGTLRLQYFIMNLEIRDGSLFLETSIVERGEFHANMMSPPAEACCDRTNRQPAAPPEEVEGIFALCLNVNITLGNQDGQMLMVPMCRLLRKGCNTFLGIARCILCKWDVCRFCI